MGFQVGFPKDWEAEDNKGGDEMFECENGINSCERPGEDQGGVLRNDGLDTDSESIDKEENYDSEGRIVRTEEGQ